MVLSLLSYCQAMSWFFDAHLPANDYSMPSEMIFDFSKLEYLSHECRLVNSKKEFSELLTAEVSLPDLPLDVKLKKI